MPVTEDKDVLLLVVHAVVGIVCLLTPGRSAVFFRFLVRQVAHARIQHRWIAVSGTELVTDTSGGRPVYPGEGSPPHSSIPAIASEPSSTFRRD